MMNVRIAFCRGLLLPLLFITLLAVEACLAQPPTEHAEEPTAPQPNGPGAEFQTPEAQKQMQKAMLRLMPKILPRIPEFSTRESLALFSLSMGDGADTNNREEFTGYTGISKEQLDEFAKSLQGMELRAIPLMATAMKAAKTDDPKELEKIVDQLAKGVDSIGNDVYAKAQKVFTPGQIGKLKELRLIGSELNPEMQKMLFDFGRYDALDLTDEQRKKLADIREEYTKEYMGIIEEPMQRILGYVEREEHEPEEFQEEGKQIEEKLKQLAARTKAKILAILTKEQTDRLDKLVANAPKFFDFLKKMNKQEPEDDSWKKSWKPGDPVPEGAVPPTSRGIFPFGG